MPVAPLDQLHLDLIATNAKLDALIAETLKISACLRNLCRIERGIRMPSAYDSNG